MEDEGAGVITRMWLAGRDTKSYMEDFESRIIFELDDTEVHVTIHEFCGGLKRPFVTPLAIVKTWEHDQNRINNLGPNLPGDGCLSYMALPYRTRARVSYVFGAAMLAHSSKGTNYYHDISYCHYASVPATFPSGFNATEFDQAFPHLVEMFTNIKLGQPPVANVQAWAREYAVLSQTKGTGVLEKGGNGGAGPAAAPRKIEINLLARNKPGLEQEQVLWQQVSGSGIVASVQIDMPEAGTQTQWNHVRLVMIWDGE